MDSQIKFSNFDTQSLENIHRVFGEIKQTPDVTIVIPVNAQKDLSRILLVASDLAAYKGTQLIEFILVVNNYSPENPPKEIDEYRKLGFIVFCMPSIPFQGGVAIAARIKGIEIARSESLLLFDADCRIPDANSLLAWYISQLASGVDLAYTHVDYFDLPPGASTKLRMLIHHASRWFKRTILGIPTCRGSNYATKRQLILDLYAKGRIPYDIHVGPVLKSVGGKIVYSGMKNLTVYTSGRFFSGGWRELFLYLIWRIGYYRRILMVKPNNSNPLEKK